MSFEYVKSNLTLISDGYKKDLKSLFDSTDEPFYFYDLNGILKRLSDFKSCFPQSVSIQYAMKALDAPLILKTIVETGAGVDVVSGGEIDKALAAGFTADKIVFSGVGKTKKELTKAIEINIKQINIESPAELKRAAEIAKDLNKTANVALRMNPDVNPETHPYIKTGFRENKFGMDKSFLPELEKTLSNFKDNLHLTGLTLHIGSQIKEIDPFIEAIEKTIPIWEHFETLGYKLKTFDIGGGVGIRYESRNFDDDLLVLEEYGTRVISTLKNLNCEVLTEPGRFIVGRFGVLVGEVQYIKETPFKKFAILNTGMHHLMRPSLYQAHHTILPLVESSDKKQVYEVVGPICESADVIGHERLMPELKQGDGVVIMDAGAYGAVMASGYNSHEPPKEIVFYNGKLFLNNGEEL